MASPPANESARLQESNSSTEALGVLMSNRRTALDALLTLIAASALCVVAGCYVGDGQLVDERWSDDPYTEAENDEETTGGDELDSADESSPTSTFDGIDEGYNALAAQQLSDAIEPSHGTGESEAEGLIDAPDELAVFVGETLEVDVYVSDPTLGNLLPAALPERAVFEPLATGGRVRWQPRLEDIGSHDFVFLIVDADEQSLVVAQRTVSVEVLPRFSLVEYGF